MTNLSEFFSESVSDQLAKPLTAIAEAAFNVSKHLPFAMGKAGRFNPFGEEQTKIDVFSNDVFATSLLGTSIVAEVASEELERPKTGTGSLHATMDPLDGSSNISTNNPLGSIFGFYSSPLPCSGKGMVAAAFVTYGPMLTFTFSAGDGVHRFAAVEGVNGKEFVLIDERIRLPDEAGVYGFGGLRREWIEPVESFVGSLERRGMKLRYGGTFVGDFNQVLRYGGIFAYPALKNRPRGKLRLLYEVAPMAFIVKQAGGLASDGAMDILSLEPSSLAETCPAYLGNTSLVRELERELSRRR
ncbi:MAG: fructose-1,6-bisphosphatase [Thaumarchaeota archaeon]|nr:fructose-1,6-bisphosphatase [Nitrososphaerota archaeon]